MSRPRRVLIVVHSYYVRDTRPRRLGAALAAAGWEVDVICARDAGEARRQRVGGVNLTRLPARRRRGSKLRYVLEYVWFTLMALLAVTAAHLRRRYRTVYVVGVPNFLVFAALVPRLLGARVLLDMRDPLPEFFQAKYSMPAEHGLMRLLLAEERVSARFASHVVTVHPSMARLYERSVPASKISIVQNAPDPRLFDLPPSAAARDPADRTMLYTGTIAAHYGVDVAVRALARLHDQVPGLRLRIVSKNVGGELPALQRLVEQLGVADLVAFDEPVPLERIPDIVATAWLGVQPGRDDPLMRYSLSAKILEWCRLGLPVAAGETAPLLEAFPGDELLFHAPGDLDALCACILEAHSDPRSLATRAERAHTAASRVDYRREMDALLEVVEG